MFHISPQREKKKRLRQQIRSRPNTHTRIHTHTGDLASCNRDNTLVLIRAALVCVDVCVIPSTLLHLWVGHEILNTLVHVVYFHH